MCAVILAKIVLLIFLHVSLFRAMLELLEHVIDHISIVALLKKVDKRCDSHWKQFVQLGIFLSVTKWDREEDLLYFILVTR